jgi:hypothetical protein
VFAVVFDDKNGEKPSKKRKQTLPLPTDNDTELPAYQAQKL